MKLAPFAYILALLAVAPLSADEKGRLSTRPLRTGLMETRESEGADEASEEPIETDRDSFTPATVVVGNNTWVVESAYSFLDNRRALETHSYPELLMRYGISERVELRLGYNFEVGGAANDVSGGASGDDEFESGGGLEREHTFSYGLKAAITDQADWTPRSVVIVQGSTPSGGASNDSAFTGTYACGWQLPNRWLWDSSLRYRTATEADDHFHIWAPSTVLKIPLGEKWTAHAEYFGLYSQGKEHNTTPTYFSPGSHYLVTPDFEVGLRVGWGLNDDAAKFFTNVGVGTRF